VSAPDKKKTLFDDDAGDAGDDKALHVNQQFAARYEHSKKAQELNRLRAKYGGDAADADADGTSESSEDSDAALDTAAKDAAFLRFLPMLVSKDPAAPPPQFPEIDDAADADADADADAGRAAAASKPLFIREATRQRLLAEGPERVLDDADDGPQQQPDDDVPYVREQELLKREFAAAAGADDDEDSGGGLLVARAALPAAKKAKPDVEERLVGAVAGVADVRKVKEFWLSSAVDEGEKFLRDYIVHQRWKGASGAGHELDEPDALNDADDDDGSDVVGENQVDIAKHFADVDSEDESEVQRQEEFEHRFNFRFEEPGGTQLITHPRSSNVESARRKDSRRAARRKAREERQAAIKAEHAAETKRLKALARAQLADKVDKLRKIAALEKKLVKSAELDPSKATFHEDDLADDFDPDAHDRRMRELFGEEFYTKLQDNKKPVFDDDLDDAELAELMKEGADFERKLRGDDDDVPDDLGETTELEIPVFNPGEAPGDERR
jgi:protein KRI1